MLYGTQQGLSITCHGDRKDEPLTVLVTSHIELLLAHGMEISTFHFDQDL